MYFCFFLLKMFLFIAFIANYGRIFQGIEEETSNAIFIMSIILFVLHDFIIQTPRRCKEKYYKIEVEKNITNETFWNERDAF